MKKILSAVFALATAITATTSAYAADVSTMSDLNEVGETINIGGYECYERDGQYWTIDDGDECLVIDVGNCDDYEVCAPVSLNEDVPFPPDWTNSRILYSPHNTEREDTADISAGDYCSPLFKVFPVDGDAETNVSYKIKCGFVFNTTINMTFYTYNTRDQYWRDYNNPYTFNGVKSGCVILVGSEINTLRGIAVRFHKNGSDNLSSFNYKFEAKALAMYPIS